MGATLVAVAVLNRVELADLAFVTQRIVHQQITEYLPTIIKEMVQLLSLMDWYIYIHFIIQIYLFACHAVVNNHHSTLRTFCWFS